VNLPRSGVTLAAVAVGLAAFLLSLTELRDWDTFHHLAYGREILRGGGFPGEDPFLYPLAGQPAGPPLSWLSSILIYLSWLAGGDGGPVVLAALLVSGVAVVVFLDGRDGDRTLGGVLLALAPVALVLALSRGRAVARPEAFANILVAGTMLVLHRGRLLSPGGAALVAFGVVLWANLHASVLLGVVLVLVYVAVNTALGAVPGADGSMAEIPAAPPLAWPLAGVVAGVSAAGVLTPAGFAPFVGALGFARAAVGLEVGAPSGVGGGASEVGQLLKHAVGELSPMSLAMWLGPYGWLVAATAGAGVLAGRRANIRELLTCAATAFLAARAQRFGPVAMIVMAPVAARHARAALERVPMKFRRAARVGAAGIAVAGIGASGWIMADLPSLRFGLGVAKHVPARAADYLESMRFEGRLFNTFHFGGYLEWRLGLKVYQDGRGRLPPGELAPALVGPSSPSWFEMLDGRYRFEALVVQHPRVSGQAFELLATQARDRDWAADRRTWALVAFDDGGLLYLRRDGVHGALAARDEYRFARPANPANILPRADELPGVVADFERSLREVRDCARCRTHLGFAYLAQQRFAEAKRVLTDALDGAPEIRTLARMGLARAEEELGNRQTAEGHLRWVLERAENPRWPRRELARLLASSGRFSEALAIIRRNAEAPEAAAIDLALGAQIARDAGNEPLARDFARRLGPGHPMRP
jgi:Tfp pilus assembly protein PilF